MSNKLNSSDTLLPEIYTTETSVNKTIKFQNLPSSRHTKTASRPTSKRVESRSRCIFDAESLQIEQVSLKSKLSELETENLQLKTRLSELETYYSQIEKDPEDPEDSRAITRVPSLKLSIKEFQSSLKISEGVAEELKARLKPKKLIEIEEEIKQSLSECLSLKKHLINALSIFSQNKDPKNYESQMDLKKEELERASSINKDYTLTLDQINTELFNKRNYERALTKEQNKKDKKLNLIISENKKIKNDIEQIEKERQVQDLEISSRQKDLDQKIAKSKNEYEDLHKKLIDLENLLKFKTEENEKNKNINISFRNALRKSRTMNIVEEDGPKKLKNPPKFFKKINEIITQKNMIIEVFLSLFDRQNKRILTIDEFLQGFEGIKGMKRKYIESALLVMDHNERYIALDLIEEWFNKFDYSEKEEPKKENKKTPQKEVQILNQRKIKTLVQHYSPTLIDVSEYSLKLSEEIRTIFNHISIQMQKMRLPKSKIVDVLLGEDFDEGLPVFQEDIESRLKQSKLKIESSKIPVFSKFLCSPEENLVFADLKSNQISKSLKRFTPDWTVYSDLQRLKFKLSIYKNLKPVTSQVQKTCKKIFGKEIEKIPWIDFQNSIISNNVNLSEETWRFWSIKFYPDYLVDYKIILRKFKTAFPADESITLIKEKKNSRNLNLTDIFSIDFNGLITILEFKKNVNKLYLGLHSYDILELICHVKEKVRTFNSETFTTANLIEVFN